MIKQSSTLIRWLRITGILEGISALVLFGIAMPLKYVAGKPEAVKYTGWIHGILFVAFMGLVMWVYYKRYWSLKTVFIAFLAAFFPFGTFIFDRWLKKQLI